ncbi:hypothetical protein ACGFS9_02920 [Streptomyces sp. NPDC048566]|uniref:hypothetical protein n=1 Tax=Streptomyces sp. NPDC048566 TaxID=3365569 RepID=UPI0037195785
MTTDSLTVLAAVLVVGITLCALLVRRALRQPLERDRIIANAILRSNPPARETEPGSAFALQAECERLWSLPDAGRTQQHAVRDEQEKGGAS